MTLVADIRLKLIKHTFYMESMFNQLLSYISLIVWELYDFEYNMLV